MAEDLRNALDTHRTDVFPPSIEEGATYGGVDPQQLDVEICSLASGHLDGDDRDLLGRAVMELRHILPALPSEARPYFSRLNHIGALALFYSR